MAGKIVKFAGKRTIFKQGDPCDTLFYVKHGAVKLTVVNKSGKEAVIALLSAGDFVGEVCISGGARFRSTREFIQSSKVKIQRALPPLAR